MGTKTARKILWHDGFHSNINYEMTDTEFGKYTDSIIKFARKYAYDTISISAIPQSVGEAEDATNPSGWLPNNTKAYKFINQFIAAAEGQGLSVGLNIAQKNPNPHISPQPYVGPPGDSNPKNPGYTDSIADLTNDISKYIEHTLPLTIGIDSQTNGLKANGERSFDVYKDAWEDQLQANNVDYDDFIIFGGIPQPSGWDASSNFKNAFEYYSEDGDYGTFNDMISGKYLNNPDGALTYIQGLIEAKALNIVGNPLDANKNYNGLVPVFSIGTGKGNALGNSQNKSPIGPPVFGTWRPAAFEAFLQSWNDAYPGTTDIITYHGDQLPTTWYENL